MGIEIVVKNIFGTWVIPTDKNLSATYTTNQSNYMLSTEELLQKRYKVIADYPNTEYEIGDIICPEKYKKNGGITMGNKFYVQYPHLFKELYWYDERTDSELLCVKYIKRVGNYRTGVIHTVAEPKYDFREWHVDNEIEFRFIKDSSFLPVTEKEYLEYQLTK